MFSVILLFTLPPWPLLDDIVRDCTVSPQLSIGCVPQTNVPINRTDEKVTQQKDARKLVPVSKCLETDNISVSVHSEDRICLPQLKIGMSPP